MPFENRGGAIVVTGARAIALARLFALRQALKLEALGMRRSGGRSVLSILKAERGWRGSRETVARMLDALIETERAAVQRGDE